MTIRRPTLTKTHCILSLAENMCVVGNGLGCSSNGIYIGCSSNGFFVILAIPFLEAVRQSQLGPL